MKNNNPLLPELRFPEFKNDGKWENVTLEEYCQVIKGEQLNKSELTKNGKYPCLNGGINPSGYTDKFNSEAETITISEGGNSCGYVNYMNSQFWLGGHCYKLKIKKEIVKLFLFQVLKFNESNIMKLRVGSGLPNIQLNAIRNFEIKICNNLIEQKKIADCLSSLDALLTAHTEKLTLLQNHKKGLLQNLFPQGDSKTPEYRFKEFEKDGEWEYINGNELFEPISNKNHNSDLPILAITQDKGAVPRDEINYNVIASEKSIESYKVVEIGDFIISLRSFQGGIEYSNYKGICSPAYIILRKIFDYSVNNFYKHYFKSDLYIKNLNKNLEGIRDGKMISYTQFSEILLPNPSPKEQQKIVYTLSSLDNLINAQTQKIAQLQRHKKGLLQGLFPKINM